MLINTEGFQKYVCKNSKFPTGLLQRKYESKEQRHTKRQSVSKYALLFRKCIDDGIITVNTNNI
jgi:hypothetical protein